MSEALRRSATVRPPAGTKLGPWIVREARGEPDPVGVADDVSVTLALGRERALSVERAALAALADHPSGAFPTVIDVGEDPSVGAYLVLQRPEPAAAAPIDLQATLEAALEIAFAVEQAGYTFTPRAGDFVVGTTLRLRRLRGAMRLPKGDRIDARSIVESLGSAVAGRLRPLLLPPALLHLVLPHGQRGRDLARHPEAVRADLVRVAPFSALPGEDAPRAAFVCDVGLHRERNEDAAAIEVHGDWTLVAVADGVSAATRAEIASRLAVETCLASLRDAPTLDATAMDTAIFDAHRALCEEPAVAAGETLGTTLVAAAVRGRQVIVGWVGDSRAYYLGQERVGALSRDHSWLEEALASGATTLEEALQSPWAHALTRCLGPLEGGDPDTHARPDVVVHDLDEPGVLLLCTDGVWNYFPDAEQLAGLLATLPPEGRSPDAMARLLVAHALLQGGRDNATVAIVQIP